MKQSETAGMRLMDTAVGALTWVAPPNPSSCGCVWRRCTEFGDVITEQCFDHAVDTVMSTLTELAAEVAGGRGTDAVTERVADTCTRLGPNVVQTLDQLFESEVARIRTGKERAP